MDNTPGSIRAKFIKHIDELLKLDNTTKEAIGFSTVMLVDARRDISLSMSDKELFALELGRALYKSPEPKAEESTLPLELRQIQAVTIILRYILNEHSFLTLAPKTTGKSVTVSETTEIGVKYQIQFERSWGNADIYQIVITVNPKWVIRISTIISNKQFRKIKISSNFGKDYFGLENVEREFNFIDPNVHKQASHFIHDHVSEVGKVIQKSSI